MIVLVCGGRNFNDRALLHAILNELDRRHLVIIHGGARGADALADEWAKTHDVPYRVFEALWSKEGRAAGVLRNQRMLDVGKPDLVIAFPGGRGTHDMIDRARRAGVPIREIAFRI